MFKLQKKVVRLICKTRYNAHTDPLFKQLNLLKIQDILKLKALKFYFRYSKTEIPEYFHDMFRVSPPSHSYQTRSALNRHISIPDEIKLNIQLDSIFHIYCKAPLFVSKTNFFHIPMMDFQNMLNDISFNYIPKFVMLQTVIAITIDHTFLCTYNLV